MLKVGDEVTAVITNIDRKAHSIQLSVRAQDAADQQAALDSLRGNAPANAGSTNLGALLRSAMSEESKE